MKKINKICDQENMKYILHTLKYVECVYFGSQMVLLLRTVVLISFIRMCKII